jgi:hypothetical protein
LAILAPIYRFLARLAAFYQGRADALLLHQVSEYSQIDYPQLAASLSPQVDF